MGYMVFIIDDYCIDIYLDMFTLQLDLDIIYIGYI